MSKKHVAILKKAKEIHKRKETGCEFLCICIKLASGEIYGTPYYFPVKEAQEILADITKGLRGAFSLNTYVKQRTGFHPSNNDLFNTRQAWLDAMIEYWKDK